MHTKIVSFSEASRILRQSGQNEPNFGVWFGMLFAGDRGSCCDEAVVVFEDNALVAIASIAPEGEAESGEPTIVGLYTLPRFRGQGFGRATMEAAILRMVERGFAKIRVDALTPGALKIIESLPDEIRAALVVHDQSAFGGLLPQ